MSPPGLEGSNDMPDDVQSEPEKTLSIKQQQAITLLVAGKSQADVAQEIGVNPKTLWRWKAEPCFVTGLREAEDAAFNEAISLLRRMMKPALITLARNMGEKVPAYVQVLAASKVVDNNLEIQKVAVLEDKIRIFEELLKESGIK